MLIYPPRYQRNLKPPTASYSTPRASTTYSRRPTQSNPVVATREARPLPGPEVSIIVTSWDDESKCWYPVEAYGPVGERLRAFVESRRKQMGTGAAQGSN